MEQSFVVQTELHKIYLYPEHSKINTLIKTKKVGYARSSFSANQHTCTKAMLSMHSSSDVTEFLRIEN